MRWVDCVLYISALVVLMITIVPIYTKEAFNTSVVEYQKFVAAANATPAQKQLNETNYLQKMYGAGKAEYNNDLLVMDRCISVDIPDNSTDYLEKLDKDIENLVFPVEKYTFEMTRAEDIDRQVMLGLEKFYIKYNVKQLMGPIYVLLFQAPYLRVIDSNCQARTLNVQYNYGANYNNLGYIVGMENPGTCSSQTNPNKTYVVMYLFFPVYNKRGRITFVNWENIKCNMNGFINKRFNSTQCFIKCMNKQDTACGCLNLDTPYKARCLDEMNPTVNTNKLVNFGTLYIINGTEASRRIGGVFGTAFFYDSVKLKPNDYITNQAYCANITRTPNPIFNNV